MPCPECETDNVRCTIGPLYSGPVSCFECGWSVWKQYGVKTYEELVKKLESKDVK